MASILEIMDSLRPPLFRGFLALLLPSAFALALCPPPGFAQTQGKPADQAVDAGATCPLPPPKAISWSGERYDFLHIGNFFLLVDGKREPAEFYRSDRLGAVLVVSPSLASPVLLRAESVSTVKPAALEKKTDTGVTLRPEAPPTPRGAFAEVDGEVRFALDGHQVALREQPPLLGLRKASEVTEHNPEYLGSAKIYAIDSRAITALRKEGKPVTVRIYYGSWCQHCRMLVPHLIRVEQELQGSQIRFEYFGVPEGFKSDPEIRKAGVQSIPTGVVYVNGTEVGRIVGDDSWRSPEATLRGLLAGSGTAGSGGGQER
jgi:thiol-disulfide isomerase/thioredoxin